MQHSKSQVVRTIKVVEQDYQTKKRYHYACKDNRSEVKCMHIVKLNCVNYSLDTTAINSKLNDETKCVHTYKGK